MESKTIKFSKMSYSFFNGLSKLLAKTIFKRTILKNDLKENNDGGLILSNHECGLDFIELMGLSKKPIHFVISKSFFYSLPFGNFLYKLGMIPKQQFQTQLKDLRTMKEFVNQGKLVGLFPAGLMPEDGVSTPMIGSLGKLVKFLNCDIYISKIEGSYFVNPKWTKGLRPGKTYVSVTKIFSKDTIQNFTAEEIGETLKEQLTYNAYEEQYIRKNKYKHGSDIEGLKNVLYICPVCHKKHSITSTEPSSLTCTECGLEVHSDQYGFLHSDNPDFHFEFPSAWSQWINEEIKKTLSEDYSMTVKGKITKLDTNCRKYLEIGEGEITLARDITLKFTENGEETILTSGLRNYPSFPITIGKCFDFQYKEDIYRIFPDEPKYVIEFVKTLKVLYTVIF